MVGVIFYKMRRGYRNSFEPKGLSIAQKTLANFLERMTEIYEQGVEVGPLRRIRFVNR